MLKKLKKNVCRVYLEGKGNGTGFLINNRYILTDKHVIEKNKKITVKFYNLESLFEVQLMEIDEKYKELDVALLKLDKEIDFYENIPILEKELNEGESWLTRGYPSVKNDRGEELTNEKHVIHQILPELDIEDFFDIELNLDTSKWSSYRGLSGSPIIVDNCIVGIILSQHVDSKSTELHGLSIKYFKGLIDEVLKKDIKTIKVSIKDLFEIEMVKVELKDKSLYVSIYPVTFEEYDLFCDDTNNEKINTYIKENRDKYPVVKITLEKAMEYCVWLSSKSDKNYRLSTSTEWMNIALKNMPKENFDDYIWHKDNSNGDVHAIGTNKAGLLGIYDLYGNIEEICSDRVTKGFSYSNSLNTIINIEKNKKLLSFPNKKIGFRIIEDID